MKEFRYERKYIVSNLQMENYRTRMAAICSPDSYAAENGRYTIRSLYLDDYSHSAFRANENGTDPRDKWRFRIYNRDPQYIRLEHKIKNREKIHKDYAVVPREFYDRVLAGQRLELEYPAKDKVVNQFLLDYFTRGLHPVVIVEYEREPYVFKEGKVRITFDENIAYSGECDKFLEPELQLVPLMETGSQLLEVKYTEFLPSVIHHALNMGSMRQSTFSKFYLCMKNERMRGAVV